jgi:hypothetical protein
VTDILTLEEQLRQTALADNALAALIGQRWGVLLDTPPCVTIQQVSHVPDYTHDGDSGLVAARYQLGLHTSCVYDCCKLRSRIEAIFSGFSGALIGGGEFATVRIANAAHHGRQPGVNLFFSTIDLVIWHRRSLE